MARDWLRDLFGQAETAASPFGGRLLTADDLAREQTALAQATFKAFTITKKTDTASTPADSDALIDAFSVLPWTPDDPLV